MNPARSSPYRLSSMEKTGHLIIKVRPDKNTTNCYVATLSDAEHAQIHTDTGMRAVELSLLAGLSTATMVTDMTTLDQQDVHTCGLHSATPPNFYTIVASMAAR
ncbi:uncharacterized protein LOC127837436 [Dreissena polymorpha]|uniref:uncharacterized protein LOC127837436 n=1 Tax=Dreissena polymorpha TaxID=45954 RepID=UPI002264EF11|nr:uncharacterized protein LOC127837436 [Dreissena polymorpha]